MKRLFTWDILLFRYINNRWRCSLLNTLMPKITHLGGAICSILFCLILLIMNWSNPISRNICIAVGASNIVVQVFKKLIPRHRPFFSLPEAYTWESLKLKDYSFPSGHTTASFSLATGLIIYSPALAPIVLPLALLVGLSRIYLGLHYPTDVIIGASLGIVTSLITCF